MLADRKETEYIGKDEGEGRTRTHQKTGKKRGAANKTREKHGAT